MAFKRSPVRSWSAPPAPLLFLFLIAFPFVSAAEAALSSGVGRQDASAGPASWSRLEKEDFLRTAGIVGTVGVFDPAKLLENMPGRDRPAVGLYMAQPYDPDKIPVVMVHGLFSSPMTWVEMFNTLRSDPEIREKYQFWFFYRFFRSIPSLF